MKDVRQDRGCFNVKQVANVDLTPLPLIMARGEAHAKTEKGMGVRWCI